MKINVIYRVCDKIDSVNGLPRPFNLSKKEIIKSCFNSLIESLKNTEHTITIIGDNLTDETKKFLDSYAACDNTITTIHYDKPLGNGNSLLEQIKAAKLIAAKSQEEFIWLCEDDYLIDYNNFIPKLNDFLAIDLKFALPIFLHPTDYVDTYGRLLRRVYVFQTKSGYWKEVPSTTFTFMCHGKTFMKFSSLLEECAPNADDGKFSSIFKKEALVFSSLPALWNHCHVGVMSNYVDWKLFIKP